MRSITAHRLNWVIGGVTSAAIGCLLACAFIARRGLAPDWRTGGLLVLGTIAGYHLQIVYRVGGQRLILVWCQAAAAVALVLEPGPWMVLATAAGWSAATFGPGGLGVVKAMFNTALNTVAATAAAVVYHALHAGPLVLTSWAGPADVLLAMLAFSAVVETGVPAVMAAASGRPFGSIFTNGLGTKCLQIGTDIALAVASAAVVVTAPKLVLAVPLVGGVAHLAYRSVAAARTERLFAQRLIGAIQAIGAGERDRLSIARRAIRQTIILLNADAAELLLYGTEQPVLVKDISSSDQADRSATRPSDARGLVAEIMEVGEGAELFGELRVFLASTVRLGERERSALRALAVAVAAELRNAAAHDELAAMVAAAAHAATHDPTTGLPGRQLLLEWVAERLAAPDKDAAETPIALACINIKGFAELLSEFATEDADQLLVHAGERLRSGAAKSERLAHLGGDTFAVWIPVASDVEHARERITHLLAVLAAEPTAEPTPVVLSGVAGLVYTTPSAASTAEQLLRQARTALRVGHRTGQPVAIYRAEDDTRGQSAIVLISELRTALRTGQLELAYDPIFELSTLRPVAVEGVAHWLHPTRGLLPAWEWITVLEQSELSARYVLWLLDEALSAQQQWLREGFQVPVEVRLPSPALLDPTLPSIVAAALARASAHPESLVLQLGGNSVTLAATDIVDKVLTEIAGQGVGIAVGTVGLSLDQLYRLPASELKLPSWTTDLVTTDQATRAKVRAVVSFADELGLRVTAHGIPSADHIVALIGLRVHAGKGPCLSRMHHQKEIVDALRKATEHATAIEDARIIAFPRRD